MDNIHRVVNNYFRDSETANTDHLSPVIILGKQYSPAPDRPQAQADLDNENDDGHQHQQNHKLSRFISRSWRDSLTSSDGFSGSTSPSALQKSTAWPHRIVDEIGARLYMTYRTDFPIKINRSPNGPPSLTVGGLLRGQLDSSGFTTDAGWGCMIRSGQILLANTLDRLLDQDRRRTISWFADSPDAPFSIHKFVHHGEVDCGKYAGEWFGPSAAARCIQILCQKFPNAAIRVYIGGDAGDVYEDRVLQASGGLVNFRPTLILLGMRLGIEKITPIYYDALKFCLQLPQAVGIAGGRPAASHYFFGYQGDNLFYLDPHFMRKALPFRSDWQKYSAEELESVRTCAVRTIQLDAMDPSMLIGFLIRDADDWLDWTSRLSNFKGKKFIHVSKTEPRFGRAGGSSLDNNNSTSNHGVDADDDDEYVIHDTSYVDTTSDDVSDFEHINEGDDEIECDDNEVMSLPSSFTASS
ncbi:hypothetical protein V1514DRAFT_310287 [Lipomyces japonicus]|uniref:uncharacterized protein n=1 Tax=Lipomyces japonicus TaxID=56871 RepID=UPI0034CFE3BC